MKFSSIFYSLTLLLIISGISYSQNPGEPFHPETANGAHFIHSTGHRLLWENPDSVVYNVIYFSSDSSLVAEMDPSVVLYDGEPNTVYDTVYLTSVEPLGWYRRYYWRVVEFYNSGSIAGPVWEFKTMPNPVCDYFDFYDDFETGLSNWTITNDGGTCVWDISTLARPYTMPPNASGNILAADADLCGSGSSTLTSITLNEPIANSQYGLVIEFDNDWRTLNSEDAAYVEMSSDNGVSWQSVWENIGISVRNSHENIYFNPSGGEIFIRFKSIQPGWDWWWAIDNVHIYQSCPLEQFYPAYNLILHNILQPVPTVELHWSKQLAEGFFILRKLGLPTDTTEYVQVGFVSQSFTNFIDSTVLKNQIYTYKIGSPDAGPSNEATAYVPDVITNSNEHRTVPTNFGLSQNYPNPFNPSTSIKFTIGSQPDGKAGRQFVTLKVYDLLGREVSILVNEEKPAGKYELEFDGQQLPSGIYFYQLRTVNFSQTKKMILLK
jgi:Secretion system C-terminal sorting domain